MSDTMTETEGTITLPGDIEAKTLAWYTSHIYRSATCVLVHNDQMVWLVAHDADGSFADRAEHRAILEELTELAGKLHRPPSDVFRVLSYDGKGTISRIPNEPYDGGNHPWPRLIITNPACQHVQQLTAQIIEDIDGGGHGDLALREKYEEAELEVEITGLWRMMDVGERLDYLAAYGGHAVFALSDELPSDPAIITELEHWAYESS